MAADGSSKPRSAIIALVKVRWIQPGASIAVGRGDVVVCIPVHSGHEHFLSCMQSVLAHTPADVPILICDDASPDSRSEEFVRKLEKVEGLEHEVLYLRREQNVGFPANVNGAFASAAPADVVVLNSDCVVAEGWLEGLREAAYVDSRVATATALTNHGSIVSVPERGRPMRQLPQDWSFDDAAAAVRSRSLRIRPRLPTAIGHCMFVRRSALELVGDFDLAFSPGYGEEVDFSQRCVRSGLCHVLADDVLVLHHGGGSFARNGRRNPIQEEHDRMIAARYPYYEDAIRLIEEDVAGPLGRALSGPRRALKGLSIVIDARILAGPMTGTQVHVLELIAALARTGEARLAAVVPEELGGYAATAFHTLPEVTLVTRREAVRELDRADVVHRPFQINNAEDLSFLARLGERLIVTNQDLIGYHNPSYFRNFAAWQGYRRITRAALAVADRVVFFSAHARDDALADDLVEPDRASVVHIGVDHVITRAHGTPTAPRGALQLPERSETILCIGTDFRHKNRIFALRMLEQLQRRHDWPGDLLLVGPRVSQGSSTSDEAEMIAMHPRLSGSARNLGAVSEGQKAWLFEQAGLVVYPTVHEGFGLVPFEAADHGVPCMWAKGTSLSELLPDDAAGIIPWDAEESADRALELLRDEQAREHNLAAIRAAASVLTWDATAARLIALYHETCDKPATPASALERRHGLMQGAFSEDAMRLIGPGGALPEDVERPLLALATHPQIGAPMFRAMKFGYRATYRLRRRGRGNGADPGDDS
jgi:glycosyltransferase involved in cell wall biosynthesis